MLRLLVFFPTLAAVIYVMAIVVLPSVLPTQDEAAKVTDVHHRLERTRVERVWIEATLTNLTPSSRSGPAVHALEGWWVGRPPARYQIGAHR